MSNLFVCYEKCTTCKKAEKWLIENAIAYTKRAIKEDKPSEGELREWAARSGLPLSRNYPNRHHHRLPDHECRQRGILSRMMFEIKSSREVKVQCTKRMRYEDKVGVFSSYDNTDAAYCFAADAGGHDGGLSPTGDR